jgi:G3E family GTPase
MTNGDLSRTPVTVVTGPAGAGKTAWIRHNIERGDWGNAVVVQGHAGVPVAGCACCAVQGDLHRTLRALVPKARRGDIGRVVIETGGPAGPSVALMADPVLASVYRLDAVVDVPGQAPAQAQTQPRTPSRLVAEAIESDRR